MERSPAGTSIGAFKWPGTSEAQEDGRRTCVPWYMYVYACTAARWWAAVGRWARWRCGVGQNRRRAGIETIGGRPSVGRSAAEAAEASTQRMQLLVHVLRSIQQRRRRRVRRRSEGEVNAGMMSMEVRCRQPASAGTVVMTPLRTIPHQETQQVPQSLTRKFEDACECR